MNVTEKITITNRNYLYKSLIMNNKSRIFKRQNRNGLQSETVSNIHIKASYMKTTSKVQNSDWKPIPLFEHYLISRSGEVYNTRTNAIKKSGKDHKGYLRVRLIDGRKRGATKKVHRLVAQAFLPNYSELLQVNHKNCIKHDNRVDNLEMTTQSQNTKHAWNNGRMKMTSRDSKGVFTSIQNHVSQQKLFV